MGTALRGADAWQLNLPSDIRGGDVQHTPAAVRPSELVFVVSVTAVGRPKLKKPVPGTWLGNFFFESARALRRFLSDRCFVADVAPETTAAINRCCALSWWVARGACACQHYRPEPFSFEEKK